jgi:LPS export ABC transporter permease LptG/LPS export ABC transporter permease LptF
MEGLGRVISALIPGILIFTLPISLLLGILVGQGRLSGDSEMIALRANGVSRLQILRPMIALALVVAAVMLYLTFSVLPGAVRNLKDLKANQALLFQGLHTQIKPRVFEESVPNKVIYVEDIDRAANTWRNIFIVDLSEEKDDLRILTAASGSLRQGARSEMPELELEYGSMHQIHAGENKKQQFQQNYTFNAFQEMTLGIEVSDQKEPEEARPRQPSVSELTWTELIKFQPRESEYRVWLAEVHKRLSYPAACLVFALLGVAFSISNVRTGRSFGLFLGLAITVFYYLLALAGEHAAVSGKLPVWLGVWLANSVLTIVAVVVIVVQRKPGTDALSLLSKTRHLLRRKRQAANEPAQFRDGLSAQVERSRRGRLVELMPQLIDRLVVSDLLRFFGFVLMGFSTLFIIITLFQLLDQISKNNIDWVVVANYLLFLMPMVLNYMTPIAALVAVMITFGLMEKTSQVVALKASGQSLYRLSAPAVIAAIVMSGVVFLNQDYLLPFTNRRQDNLRHLILSGQEPPQTFYQTTRKWIFGGDSRIYNYAHFNPTDNVFARLTVFDLSRSPFGIKSRLYARRAIWDQESESWLLKDGWERRFDNASVTVENFEERRLAAPEQPSYFKKDSRASSMMTLGELRQQITDLSRAGFDVLDLRVSLHSKIAFPLACLIMVIVGLPFAFSVGKRGALYGVALGIAIGLAYWGLLGLFEQMGRYEMLPPMLAAWAPNILFGAGGAYLFLTSRT